MTSPHRLMEDEDEDEDATLGRGRVLFLSPFQAPTYIS